MRKSLYSILERILVIFVASGLAYTAQAQFNNPNTGPNLSGDWSMVMHEDWQEQLGGPNLVDYLGLPLTEEAVNRGLSWDATSISMPERQCLYYAPPYILQGPFGLAIWNDTDPINGKVISWSIGGVLDMTTHVIWVDGRKPASELTPRDIGGPGYGEWIGNTLKAEFPHMREGFMRRNGVPMSDQTTMTLYLTLNEGLITVTGEVWDPVYMTEPLILSRVFQRNEYIPRQTGDPCSPLVEMPNLDGRGDVPHYLPGQNPALTEFAETHGIPLETALGGAETMYPEYRDVISESYQRPDMCITQCCMTAMQGILGGPTFDPPVDCNDELGL
jgi:hypothetical protein